MANLALVRLLADVRTRAPDAAAIEERERLRADNGPWLLLLLMVSGRVTQIRAARRKARS